jgi:tripartite ATP-independent transporter DctP family solute receptor
MDELEKARRTMLGLRLAAVAIALLLVVQPGQARDLVSSDIQARDYPTVQAVAYMGELLRERTGGRLKITSLGHSDPDSEAYTLAELRNGRIDMARMTLTPFNNLVPASIFPSLPFLFKSTVQKREVLDGPIGQDILASLEAAGVIGLAFYDGGARSFYSDKPIRRPSDLQGMKVRVQGSQVWMSMIEALGAKPVPLEYKRVGAALKSGLVDAAENHVILFQSSRHFESAKVLSLTEHTRAPTVLLFSKKVWDTLPEEDCEIIRTAARDSVSYMRKLWDEREAAAMASLEANGVAIVTDIDRQAFFKAMLPVYQRYVTEPRVKTMVNGVTLSNWFTTP